MSAKVGKLGLWRAGAAGLLCLALSCGFAPSMALASQPFDGAQQMRQGSTYQGNFGNKKNYFYKFSLTQDGYVDLTVNYTDPDDGWQTLYLYDGQGNMVKKIKFEKNSNWSTKVTRHVGLSKGTYYVQMHRDYNHSEDKYTLSYATHAANDWESEFNGSIPTADPLTLGQGRKGSLGAGYYYDGLPSKDSEDKYEYDMDFYKVSTPADGYLTINFQAPKQSSNDNYWLVALYNDSEEKISSWLVPGGASKLNLSETGVPAGTYYIRVCSAETTEDKSNDAVYTITANFDASDSWEKELNNDFQSATPFKVGTPIQGVTTLATEGAVWNGDTDYYVIDVPEDGDYKLTINVPNQRESDAYWDAYLYDSNQNEVGWTYVGGGYDNAISKHLTAGGSVEKVGVTAAR